MSPPYLNAIAGADRCISQILDAWQAAGWLENTTICIVSDHGGHERTHGTDHDDDILIPFILSGAGIKRGASLPDDIRVFDTCCTLADLLGLPQDRTWEGRVVQEAMVS
jgi:arylsulfatase A-like enzyme